MKLPFFLFLFFLISCTSLNKVDNTIKYKYVSKISLVDNDLLTYSREADTILIVIKKDLSKKCTNLKFVILDDLKMKKISNLKDNNKTIDFHYIIKSTDGLKVKTGNFAPNNTLKNETIYSYKSFPYLIENCEQIR